MKKWMTAAAAAALLAASPAPAAEDGEKITAFGVDMGYFAPFEGRYNGGFTGRAVYDMHYWDPIGVRIAAGLALVDAETPAGDVGLDILYLSGGIVYTFDSGKVYPYATFGLGLYNISADKGGGSSTEFGVNFGGGVEIPLAENMFLAPELTFHLISGDGPDTNMAFTLGLRFQLP
jgi:opacity protein-like surface antigen